MYRSNVLVIGLGLIGGSLALGIKKQHPKAHIIGYDVDEKQQELAESLGVIDERINRVEDGTLNADLIIIAAPVLKTEEIMDQLMTCSLKNGAIVTDVGSTKQEIMNK